MKTSREPKGHHSRAPGRTQRAAGRARTDLGLADGLCVQNAGDGSFLSNCSRRTKFGLPLLF